MALSKRISLGNGVAVTYHRVVGLTCTTNVQNTIEVARYTSRALRDEECESVAAGRSIDVYVHTAIHSCAYDQGMTVTDAYAWLKSNAEEFDGATDVLEGDQDPVTEVT